MTQELEMIAQLEKIAQLIAAGQLDPAASVIDSALADLYAQVELFERVFAQEFELEYDMDDGA